MYVFILIENREIIRHFFYNFAYIDDLNSIRPTTKAEIELRKLNTKPHETFITDMLVLNGEANDEKREFGYIYERYITYARECGQTVLKKNYFSNALMNAGYETKRLGPRDCRKYYVQGQTNNVENEEDEYMM
jgi:hypothetical protein